MAAVNYGQPVPNLPMTLCEDTIVFILDFSYSRKTLLEIASKARAVVVLDHHVSAEKEIGDIEFCVYAKGIAGCDMTWYYLYPEVEIHPLIAAFGDRDVWKFNIPDTKAICAGFNAKYDYRSFLDFDWIFDNPDSMIEIRRIGKVIEDSNQKAVVAMASKASIVEINGARVAVLNNGFSISEIGNVLATRKDVDLALVYFIGDGFVSMSFRGVDEKRSAGDFATSLGGGGQRNAASVRYDIDNGLEFVRRLQKKVMTTEGLVAIKKV